MIYDLLIIGGGPAGYRAAEMAGKAGMSVALIEKRALGGVCLNEGCIPTKTFLVSAKRYEHARDSEKYGVTASDVKLDHAKVVARKDKVVRQLVGGVAAQMKAAKVTVISGEAVIDTKTADGFAVKCGADTYTAKRLLVASGSVPVVPPIPGAKEGMAAGYVVTNRELLDLKTLPQNLTIVGGGVIGLEMASYFRTAGSHVTVVEMLDHIAGPTDSELSAWLLRELTKQGVDFRLGAKVVGMDKDGVSYEKDGKTEKVPSDVILMSIGRRANTRGLNLEALGVEMNRGAVVTDEHLQTNVAGVWAAGDVNGKIMLAHTAYREADVAVNNMLGKRDVMRYSAIPSVIYTNPEIASVGMTEEAAKAAGVAYTAKKLSMRYSGRFIAENEGGDGFCKVMVDDKYHRIIGVHMVGNSSSEIIWGAAELLETELRIEDVKEIVFPHPTVSEVLRDVVFEF